jgi:hypothetical protein
MSKWDPFDQIKAKLDLIIGRLDKMAIDQGTFDTDLAALVAAINNLIAAINTALANKTDLTAEDQEVQTAAASVATELANITPPPAP